MKIKELIILELNEMEMFATHDEVILYLKRFEKVKCDVCKKGSLILNKCSLECDNCGEIYNN